MDLPTGARGGGLGNISDLILTAGPVQTRLYQTHMTPKVTTVTHT